ncbi:hypothetical protein HGRIS_013304 [Hohenbuehelia grisea]|uniref:Uncharacterized protein n=1 Tax=Hohenbuehelia grisea TaxID=104357 RepID=A0ABR3IV13_9AGAR
MHPLSKHKPYEIKQLTARDYPWERVSFASMPTATQPTQFRTYPEYPSYWTVLHLPVEWEEDEMAEFLRARKSGAYPVQIPETFIWFEALVKLVKERDFYCYIWHLANLRELGDQDLPFEILPWTTDEITQRYGFPFRAQLLDLDFLFFAAEREKPEGTP